MAILENFFKKDRKLFPGLQTLTAFAAIVVILAAVSGCGGSGKTVTVTPKVKPEAAFSREAYDALIQKGDRDFEKMHLYGWRKADEAYAEAYGMKKSRELRDKRFLTLCLIAIREKHEQIVNPGTYKKIDALGPFEKSLKQNYLADLVQGYRTHPTLRDKQLIIEAPVKKKIDPKAFNISRSPLEFFLFIRCVNYFSITQGMHNQTAVKMLSDNNVFPLLKQYEDSPLVMYFNISSIAGKEDEILKKYPQFAEIILLKGNKLFKNSKLKPAGQYYRHALELIPDYTKAMVGMGNIYFLTVQDYETAIAYYDNVLEKDSLQPVALFGKGASLHRLSRYADSDAVFDFMLENQPYYLGEAYYYKAYNQYHQGNVNEARRLIDKAKELLPRSGEVLYLSGLMYFREKRFKKAFDDFYDCLYDRFYSPCFPLHYIGMIRLKNQNWKFLENFNESIACFEEEEASLRRKLLKIDDMDLEPRQRTYMKQRQTKRIAEFQETAGQVVSRMTKIIDKNKHKKAQYEKDKETTALRQVKKILAAAPGRLNERDAKDDNQSLLHKSVIKGHVQAVEYLLKEGANVNMKDSHEFSPLKWAVMLEKIEITRLLLVHGADVNEQDPNKLTVLHDAAYKGNIPLVKLLLKKGARLDMIDDMGRTPLDMAIENRKPDVYPLLKPLHLCAAKGDTREMRRLMQIYRSLLNAGDENGNTPLHLAAQNGHTVMVRLLLEKKAPIDARDADGLTALQLAKRQNRAEVVNLLLQKGAAPSDSEIIEKEFNRKEAALWYLGSHGWGIKTRNHFLIFDYHPSPNHNGRRPKNPGLANGIINPSQLNGQNVSVFLSSDTHVLNRNNPIFKLQDTLPGVRYISTGKNGTVRNHTTLDSNGKSRIGDMDILTFTSTTGPNQTGFLIRVDGVSILFAGDQGYWKTGQWEAYCRGIDFLRTEAGLTVVPGTEPNGIDIALLPIPRLKDMQFLQDIKEYEKGIAYVLEHLRPNTVIPMVNESDEFDAVRVARDARGNGLTQINGAGFIAPRQKGDRFFYTGGQIQSHH